MLLFFLLKGRWEDCEDLFWPLKNVGICVIFPNMDGSSSGLSKNTVQNYVCGLCTFQHIISQREWNMKTNKTNKNNVSAERLWVSRLLPVLENCFDDLRLDEQF